jgi:hypothetical protein
MHVIVEYSLSFGFTLILICLAYGVADMIPIEVVRKAAVRFVVISSFVILFFWFVYGLISTNYLENYL